MIKDLSKIVNHCQRNWSYDTPIPQDHIDTIVNAGRFMPTKQNLKTYTIAVITNPDIISYLFRYVAFSDDSNRFKQPQVDAPLLLLYLLNNELNSLRITETDDLNHIEVGLSAGASALQAAELGYKTGFCRCFDDVERLVNNGLGLNPDDYKFALALGIGKPLYNNDHTIQYSRSSFPEHNGRPHKSNKKNIQIIKFS